MTTASTGASFMPGASRALLPWQNKTSSPSPAAEAVHGHDRVGTRTEFRRVFFVHELRAEQQQFATRHVRVFLGGDHLAFDFGEEHKFVE